jgi:type IV secretion system protein VirD4
MYIVASEPVATRTLATLRDHLTLASVACVANCQFGKSDREAAGVLSSAQRHTHFLDSPRMTTTFGHSDFSFADLKERPVSIFLVLPPDRLDTYARWLRLMVVQALTELVRVSGCPPLTPDEVRTLSPDRQFFSSPDSGL